MKRNALLTLVCCLVMGALAMVATPRTALAIPYHAAGSELQGTAGSELRGTAYAVFNPTTGEFDFVRSTETHENESVGTVKSISGGSYTGTIYTGFETGWCDWYSISSSVKSVRFVDAVRPTGLAEFFAGMENCKTMDLSRLDTSQAVLMNGMFDGCKSLTSLDVSGFDTSQAVDVSGMFWDCVSLTSLDLSSFDTSNVTDPDDPIQTVKGMDHMFDGCTSLNKITFGDKFVIN